MLHYLNLSSIFFLSKLLAKTYTRYRNRVSGPSLKARHQSRELFFPDKLPNFLVIEFGTWPWASSAVERQEKHIYNNDLI